MLAAHNNFFHSGFPDRNPNTYSRINVHRGASVKSKRESDRIENRPVYERLYKKGR